MNIQTMCNTMELMMDNKEFFQLLKDMRDEVQKVSTKVDTLYTKLFIGNGQASFDRRVTLVENNQANCPARQAAGTESKALKVSIITAVASACAVALSLIGLFK